MRAHITRARLSSCRSASPLPPADSTSTVLHPIDSPGLHRYAREEWLTAALSHVRSFVGLPARIRVACGFPSTFTRSGTLAESWPDTESGDATWEVLISPTVAEPTLVLSLLIGAVAHALPGAATDGSATYQSACVDLGLMPDSDSWRTPIPGPDFGDQWAETLAQLGPYPHAPILTGAKKTQGTRMLKLTCPTCGYNVRTTAKWIAVGLPVCPCGDTLAPEATEATETE